MHNLEEKGSDIEKLVKVASDIQNLYNKKLQQLEALQLEISELKEMVIDVRSVISTKSFRGADELYLSTIEKEKEKTSEEYFSEEVPGEQVKGTKIKRKVFTQGDDGGENLAAVLDFVDMNKITIKFLSPKKISIEETSEDFVRVFLKGALVTIKEKSPNLSLSYSYYKNSDIIQSIKILGASTIEEFDLITSKIQELLANN